MGMFDQIAVADGANLLLGRGACFLDRKTAAGVNQGFNFTGNITKFDINISVETKDKRGFVDDTNPLLSRVVTAKTLEVDIAISEYRKEGLAIKFLGDVGEYTQTATPITGESLSASSTKGRTYFAAKRKLTAITVKDDGVAATLNTDYQLDTETGAVKVLSTGTIMDGSVLTIDYTPTVMTAGTSGYTKISGGSAGSIVCEARFIGKPMAGKIHEAHLWKMQMTTEGALALLSDDYQDFELKGTLLDDSVNHASPDNFFRMLQY